MFFDHKKQILYIIFFFFSITLSSCSSQRPALTDFASFKDPAYQNNESFFNKLTVYVVSGNLYQRSSFEKYFCKVLSDSGVNAIPSVDLFPPTRSLSDNEKTTILIDNEIEGMLVVMVGDNGVDQIALPTEITKSLSTIFITPKSVNYPWSFFEVYLIDYPIGNIAWRASALSTGNGYSDFTDLMNSFCIQTISLLSSNNLLLTKNKKIHLLRLQKINQEQQKLKEEKERIALFEKQDSIAYEKTLEDKRAALPLLTTKIHFFYKEYSGPIILTLQNGNTLEGKIMSVESEDGLDITSISVMSAENLNKIHYTDIIDIKEK